MNKTPNERSKDILEQANIVHELAWAICSEMNVIKPEDLPNMFVTCLVTSLRAMDKVMNIPKEHLLCLANNAVNGLILSLNHNGFNVPHAMAPLDKDSHLGFSEKPMGTA